jgi:uncharacterized membrane protein (UPF0127 family)
MRVVDVDRGVIVVSAGRLARTFWSRLRGLLGTPPLQPGQGLLLEPCNSIHMFCMGYPIDALYLDAENRVLRVVVALAPWRIGPTVWQARRVLELPAGQVHRCGVQVGDCLEINP